MAAAAEVRGDTTASIEFLRRWATRGPWVLSASHPHVAGLETQKFIVGEEIKMRAWIEARQGHKNIYYSVNQPRDEVGHTKATKADIGLALALHVDVDPRDGEDLETERTMILGRIKELRPAPTVIIDSGGGYQAFWKFDEAIVIESVEVINQHTGELAGPGVPELINIERHNRGIRAALGVADHCHNIDRIMRLPGTINIPNVSKLKKGRIRAASSYTANWDLVYNIKDLSRFADLVTAQEAADELQSAVENPEIDWDVVNQIKVEIDDLPIHDELKNLIKEGNLPGEGGNGLRYRGRSEAVFGAIIGLVRADISGEVISAIMRDKCWKIGAHVREQKQARRYLIRQIARARAATRDEQIAAMNAEFAVVSTRGKVVVIHEHLGIDGEDTFDLMGKASFEMWTSNLPPKFITTKDGFKPIPIGTFWLNHALRRQYLGIAFRPGGELRASWYNLWHGFAIEPAESGAGCEKFLAHLRDNVAQGNEELYRWIITWFADLFQNPGKKPGTALVLRGRQGVGKTIVGKTMKRLLDRHCVRVTDTRGLFGQFNMHLASCLLLHVDEMAWFGDKTAEGKLRDLVTGEVQWIEPKNVDMFQVDNYIRPLITGDRDWLVPAGMEERRFAVVDVGEGSMQDSAYFIAIEEELDNGGAAALLRFLLDWKSDNIDVRKIPDTAALVEQKIQSLNPEARWWLDTLMAGVIPMCRFRDEITKVEVLAPNVCPVEEIFESYLNYGRSAGLNKRAAETGLGMFLRNMIPGLKKERRWYKSARRSMEDSRRGYVYTIASLIECREEFSKMLGSKLNWPEGGEDNWAQLPEIGGEEF